MNAIEKINAFVGTDWSLEKIMIGVKKEVQLAFEVLRSFEPPGIGAFDLRDCLIIQASFQAVLHNPGFYS